MGTRYPSTLRIAVPCVRFRSFENSLQQKTAGQQALRSDQGASMKNYKYDRLVAAATGEEEEDDTEQDFSDADLMIPQEEN